MSKLKHQETPLIHSATLSKLVAYYFVLGVSDLIGLALTFSSTRIYFSVQNQSYRSEN